MKNLIKIIFVFTLLFLVSCAKDKSKKQDIVKIDVPTDSVVQVEKKIEKKIPALIFTVQIGAFKKANTTMNSISNIKVTQEGSLYKYSLGNFSSYSLARKYKKSLLDQYPDAFVQALKMNKPVNIIEALK
tara:strand:+ start:8104 stop:8493 length:390 start_codon:yes stop_codon:yes gene_type:complete